jgi:serine/threonine protein kinase
MDPDRWREIERLCQAALERPESERAAFLDQACAGDAALRDEVKSLLAQGGHGASFIESPALEVAAQALVQDEPERRRAAEEDPRLGKTISHYHIVQKLGGGGMGVVYKAEDTRLRRPVALKFLSEDVWRDREALKRFQREARAASALNHPHICTIHELGEEAGEPYIVMECLEGETLRQRLARDVGPNGVRPRPNAVGPYSDVRARHGVPLPIAELLDLALQISDALDAAHRKGIIHRDIKPANIFITTDGQVKVLDFGLAKIAGPASLAGDTTSELRTATGAVAGTAQYMSPEQALGQAVDARTDLFSFGSVIYEMAAGRVPFPGSNLSEIIAHILHSSPEPIGRLNYDVPHALEWVVCKCLEKEPALRYQSASELRTDLLRLKRDIDSQRVVAVGVISPPVARPAVSVGPDRIADRRRDEPLKTPSNAEQATTPLSAFKLPQVAAEEHLTDPALGALQQRYDILAELGRGGMGIVYKARDHETGAVVALKVLRPEIAGDAALIARFKSELLLARKITHKNVCRIYDLHRFGETAAIAMEFVEGESLRAFLKRCRGVPLRGGLEWAKEICGALAEAHAQGVIHRDLKPENIFIDAQGRAKVMDFGIARSVETTATQTGGTFGTPAYMSPEQAEGKPADARSDIYALGLVFYEMFAGRAAFQADTPVSFALKQIHETPPPPRSVEPYLPLFLDSAIQKCLEKDPAKRFQSAEELSAALAERPEAIISIVESSAKEAPLPDHLATWQRWDWGLLSGALVGFILFFILFDQVFPFGAMAPLLSREDAIKATKRIVDKHAPEFKDRPYTVKEADYRTQLIDFPFNVIHEGPRLTMKFFLEGYPGRTVYIPSGAFSVNYNHQGQPLQLALPWPSREQTPKQILSEEEVLPLATQAAEDLFGVHLAGVAPVPLNCDPQHGCRTSDNWELSTFGPGLPRPVLWTLPGYTPETRICVLVLALPGRLLTASEFLRQVAGPNENEEASQSSGRWFGANQTGVVVSVIYWLLCFILSLALRVYRQSSRVVWVASFIMAGGVLGSYREELGEYRLREDVILQLVGCIAAWLVCFAFLSLPYRCILNTLQSHLKTFRNLLNEGWRARPAGLAILRGIGLGALYLVLHASTLCVLGTLRLAAPGYFWKGGGVFDRPAWEQVIWVLGLSFFWTVAATWLGVGLPLSLLRRATKRLWLVLAATGLFWAVTAASLPGASAFPALPLYLYSTLQGVFLAMVFWRYDLLTSMMTVLTIETWLVCYPFYRMFGGLEPWPYMAALFPWFLMVLLGTVVWLRSPVAAAWRRAAAVLE